MIQVESRLQVADNSGAKATRQGSGKGAPVGWCAPVKPGRVLYEIKGVDLELAKRALTLASHKLPVKTVIVVREGAFE